MKYPNLKEEKKLWKKGFKYIIGLDEAGRGPLAGPVVVAGVLINPKIKKLVKGINDSKKLSKKQREKLYKILVTCKDIKWSVAIVSEKIIDKINILEATKLAMRKVVKKLNPDFLILDGNFLLDISLPQKSVVKGDSKVLSVAAASIIAKVTRDRLMKKYHKKYPSYGFDSHKGYGSEFHMKMIKKYGPCPIHRKSFFPISELIKR